MFKFRRASLCSSKTVDFDILSDSDSTNGETSAGVDNKGNSSSVKQKSVVDPRTLSSSKSQSDEKEFEASTEISSPRESQSVSGGGGGKTSGCLPGGKWSFNGDKLKANLIGHVMYDRKRKERQESISQGQERKVIRCADAKKSLSDDEGLNDSEKAKDFKRTLSHDNFNPKSETDLDANSRKGNQETGGVMYGTTVITVKNVGPKTESSEPLILSDQPLANTMIKFPGSYEPELQRQMERSMNYSSSPVSKGHRRHRRRHRSSRHDSNGSVADAESDGRPEEIESPVTGSSSSESLDEERSIPMVKIDDSSSAKADDFELELSNLHHGAETSKPISFLESISGPGANDQVMLSPRSGFLIRDAMDLPPSPPMMQIHFDPPSSRQSLLGENESTKINSLTHQVTNLKRHLRILEEEYEQVYGYKPSHADKLNNKEIKKCLMQLAKAKRDLKQLKEDPAAIREANLLSAGGKSAFISRQGQGNSNEPLKSLDETVAEIQEFLSNKRRVSGRANEPEDMSSSELLDEKAAMQRQLLLLEKRHGRPCSKQEKDIVRPLYDRYRAVKKFSIRAVNIKDANPDLVPILEHETLEFPEIDEGISPSCSVVEIKKDFVSLKVHGSRLAQLIESEAPSDEEDFEDARTDSFNNMNLSELEKRQRQVKEDKRRLRNILRKFESDFEDKTGRPPSKEEKYSTEDMQASYVKYKRARQTIRLLEVLISKKKYPQLLADLSKSED